MDFASMVARYLDVEKARDVLDAVSVAVDAARDSTLTFVESLHDVLDALVNDVADATGPVEESTPRQKHLDWLYEHAYRRGGSHGNLTREQYTETLKGYSDEWIKETYRRWSKRFE